MNKNYLFLFLIFIAYWFLPDVISFILFGLPIGEGLQKFAGQGLYYIGRDIDFFIEGLSFLKSDSIWYLKPISEVLPEILSFALIGLSQLVCLYLIRKKIGFVINKNNQINQSSEHTVFNSMYLAFFAALISGCLLFISVLIAHHYYKMDILFSLISGFDKSQVFLLKHPLYFGVSLLVGCLGAAVFEEYFFRKALFSLLRKSSSFFISTLISTLFFCLVHQGDLLIWLQTFYCGVISCIIYEKSRHIIGCILFHFLGNLFILVLPLFYPISSF